MQKKFEDFSLLNVLDLENGLKLLKSFFQLLFGDNLKLLFLRFLSLKFVFLIVLFVVILHTLTTNIDDQSDFNIITKVTEDLFEIILCQFNLLSLKFNFDLEALVVSKVKHLNHFLLEVFKGLKLSSLDLTLVVGWREHYVEVEAFSFKSLLVHLFIIVAFLFNSIELLDLLLLNLLHLNELLLGNWETSVL